MNFDKKNMLRGFYMMLSATFIAACSGHKQIESDIQTYTDRLESFTEIPLPESEITSISALESFQAPKKSALRIDIPELSINLREFYAFSDCALNQVIAQRNTSLGKMQLPAARYAYETNLLQEFDRCITILKQDLEENQNLVSKLGEWSSTKQTHLPLAYANLITQSDEIYAHFFRANDFISGNEDDNFPIIKQAFRFLVKANENIAVDIGELEYHLQQLNISPLMARKWRTQAFLTNELDRASVLLNTYYETNTCASKKQEEDIMIMRNIFTKLFADNIQPVAAELNKYHYQLSPLIETLIKQQSLPDSFVEYVNFQQTTAYNNYAESMRQHIKIWQNIFARCDE